MIVSVSGPFTDMVVEHLPHAINAEYAVINNEMMLSTPAGLIALHNIDNSDRKRMRIVRAEVFKGSRHVGLFTQNCENVTDVMDRIQVWAEALDQLSSTVEND